MIGGMGLLWIAVGELAERWLDRGRADLVLSAHRCPHGVWHSHNVFMLEDGTTIEDPDGSCPGGWVEAGDKKFGISHGLASSLRHIESVLGRGVGEDATP